MDMDGTDSMDGTTGTTEMMMTMAWHFTPFDQLWFSSWAPQSNGAMFGACLGLFLLAVVDRWLSAMRGLSEVWWKRRTDAILARRNESLPPSSPSTVQSASVDNDKKVDDVEDCCNPTTPIDMPVIRYNRIPPPFPTRGSRLDRLIPPFIFAHDIPRGVFQFVQAALGYGLMLVVMTFNASYFFSILVGLAVGETLFGRYANHGEAHSMSDHA